MCRFLLGLLLAAPLLSSAQTTCRFTLSGRVADSQGTPLPGAAVMLSGHSGMSTDASGAFSFTDLCAGSYLLTVRYLGYTERKDSVSVPAPPLDIRLAVESRQLENIVIEDQHAHGSISQTESVLSGKNLERMAGRSLGEALKSLPGITSLQTGPSVFKPAIHGLHSSRVLILNNGVRLEGQQWGADHAPEIDPFTASSLSVIKDATAIKYGSDALGGIVMVNPPELPSTPGLGGELSLIGSTNGRMGIVAGQLEGSPRQLTSLGWRIQGTLRKAGDFQTPDYMLTNTGLAESNVSAAIGYHGERNGVELFASHFSGDLGILRGSVTGSLEDLALAMETEPPAYTEDFSYSVQSPRQRAQHDLIKAKGHHHFINDQVLRFQYAFQSNHRKEFDVRKGNLNEIPSIDLKLLTHTLDGEWEHVHHDRRLGSAGVNLIFQDNKNIPGTQRIPFIPNYQNVTAGIYLIEQWPRGRWTIETGARYDFRNYDVRGRDYRNELYYSTFSFGNIGATAGARLSISPHSTFISNMGLAWRPPNVAELYSFGLHQSAGAIEYGLLLDPTDNHILDTDSADIRAETAVKWVNTYSHSKEGLRFEATLHTSVIDNFITLRPGGVTTTVRGAFPYFRYSQATTVLAGIDGFLSWAVSKHFQTEIKASLLRARDIENTDDLLYIPSNQGQVSFQYQSPEWGTWRDAYISLGVQAVARQKNAPRTITVSDFLNAADSGQDPLGGDDSNFDFAHAPPGYLLGTVQCGISHPVGHTKLSIRVEVTNLFNTDYREYTNRMRYYVDDTGRNLSVAVKYVF